MLHVSFQYAHRFEGNQSKDDVSLICHCAVRLRLSSVKSASLTLPKAVHCFWNPGAVNLSSSVVLFGI